MNRRRFLTRCGLLAGGLATAAGCVDADRESASAADRAAAFDPGLACDDVSGLWPVEVATRADNDYTSSSKEAERYCFNCSNFIEPQRPGECGACRTVKGPIQPLGWCKSWTEKKT